MEIPPGTALLYPHPRAQRLDRCPAASRPAFLLALDGTWSNARQLYRDNSWLGALPHVSLAPTEPGRYRIRGEPQLHCLSTVEAIVQALQVLEPDTPGLGALLAVFDAMIDAQVHRIQSKAAGPRYKRPRQRPPRQIPPLLLTDPRRVLVTYVETVPGPRARRRPVHWAAVRPLTGESFERILRPEGDAPAARQLAHMQLLPADLEAGITLPRLQEEWGRFAGEDPVVAAWNQSTLDVVRATVAGPTRAVMLKAAYCNVSRLTCGPLEAVMEREGLETGTPPCRGRAGQRLGMALAVLEYLVKEALP